jgi:hypothetical protein
MVQRYCLVTPDVMLNQESSKLTDKAVTVISKASRANNTQPHATNPKTCSWMSPMSRKPQIRELAADHVTVGWLAI